MSDKKTKKKFEENSPEWQLYQNLRSTKLLIGSHATDAERSLVKSADARSKYERYLAALKTLQPDFKEDEYE